MITLSFTKLSRKLLENKKRAEKERRCNFLPTSNELSEITARCSFNNFAATFTQTQYIVNKKYFSRKKDLVVVSWSEDLQHEKLEQAIVVGTNCFALRSNHLASLRDKVITNQVLCFISAVS
jgi:hypothetical protein